MGLRELWDRSIKLYQSNAEALEAVDLSEKDAVEWAHPDIEYVFTDGPTPGIWRGWQG